jgi:hypothetical protein
MAVGEGFGPPVDVLASTTDYKSVPFNLSGNPPVPQETLLVQ